MAAQLVEIEGAVRKIAKHKCQTSGIKLLFRRTEPHTAQGSLVPARDETWSMVENRLLSQRLQLPGANGLLCSQAFHEKVLSIFI